MVVQAFDHAKRSAEAAAAYSYNPLWEIPTAAVSSHGGGRGWQQRGRRGGIGDGGAAARRGAA